MEKENTEFKTGVLNLKIYLVLHPGCDRGVSKKNT